MNHHIFYGEIRNQIVSELFKNPDYLFEIDRKIEFENEEETIFTLCCEAAQIFYTIQDLSGHCHSTDVTKAIKHYSSAILNQLVKDKKLTAIDLIVMASETIKEFC